MTASPVLTIPATLWNDLRADLLSTPELERAAVGFAGTVGGKEPSRLLLRDWTAVPLDEYLVQRPYHLEVSPVFWARAAKRARETGEAVVIAHSHPHSHEPPEFSPSDDGGEDDLVPKIHQRASIPVAAVVLSPGGVTSRLTLPAGRRRALSLRLVGQPEAPSAPPPDLRGHDRQIRALGRDGHATITGLTVGVVGAGGLGSHVIQQLLHLGVGRIIVVDPDRVETTNLSRLVGATRADVRRRRPKTTVASRLARQLNSSSSVVELKGSTTEVSVVRRLLECDVVIGCTDNHWSRMVLNGLAFQYYLPVVDLGVELQISGAIGGRVTWLAPGSPCLWCLGILDAERIRVEQLPPAVREHDLARGYIQDLDEPAPAVVSINGVVASLGVTELLARTTGFAGSAARPSLLLYRLAEGDVRRVSTSSRDHCPTCSTDGLLGLGDLCQPPWLSGALAL